MLIGFLQSSQALTISDTPQLDQPWKTEWREMAALCIAPSALDMAGKIQNECGMPEKELVWTSV